MARPPLNPGRARRVNEGFTYRERIPALPAGTGVLEYLAVRYPHSPRAAWEERIASGLVLIDGNPVHPGDVARPGARLEWRRPPWDEPEPPAGISVLHEDSDLAAVEKPPGLPTLPGAGFLDFTLLALVRKRFPGATPLHRLGRWTSGIVLFALTGPACAFLAREFHDRRVHKEYRTLASGVPREDRWRIEVPIGPVPHAGLGTVHAASPAGRASESEVTVVERREDAFLADVVIRTGRPHQIRIHLAVSGHPLVGDPLYPVGGVPDPDTTALPGDPGYLLHARCVEITHPATGRPLRLESPCPDTLLPRGGNDNPVPRA